MKMEFNPQSLDESAALLHEIFMAYRRAGFTYKEALFILACNNGAKVPMPDEEKEEVIRSTDAILDRMKDES